MSTLLLKINYNNWLYKCPMGWVVVQPIGERRKLRICRTEPHADLIDLYVVAIPKWSPPLSSYNKVFIKKGLVERRVKIKRKETKQKLIPKGVKPMRGATYTLLFQLAGAVGLEPTTQESKSCVLPITPPGKDN